MARHTSCRPKSVPGDKMKSKFISSRTNAVKEIEAWVKGDDALFQRDAVRMSGQLTDNVTEERMLKAKLWELSRERYKFLSQSAYERKVFMDRMQRKSSANRRSALQIERIANEQKGGRKIKSSNARLALLDRFDPTKSRDRPKEFKEDSDSRAVATKGVKSVHFVQKPVTDDTTDPQTTTTTPQIAVLSEQNLAKRERAHRSYSASDCRRLPSLGDHVSQKSEDTQSTATFQKSPGQPAEGGRRWAARRVKSSSISSSCSSLNYIRHCTDPRIVNLESSLAPVYSLESCPDVSAVVREIGSLHLPPKINKETTRPKTAVKILDYMRAKGLLF